MKKRILAMIFAAFMAMSLTACGSSSDNSASDSDIGSAVAEETEETEEEETSSAEDGVLGSYVVEITGAELCEDYEGNPAIIICYNWTNNSDDTTSALVSMYTETFQDGVQLETAIVDFEYEDGLSDVRPGTTVEVEEIFTLTSDSVVEVEISAVEDMFADDVPMVTAEFDPAELETR